MGFQVVLADDMCVCVGRGENKVANKISTFSVSQSDQLNFLPDFPPVFPELKGNLSRKRRRKNDIYHLFFKGRNECKMFLLLCFTFYNKLTIMTCLDGVSSI